MTIFTPADYINQDQMKRILFIIASLRKASFNRQVSEFVKDYIGDRAAVSEPELSDVPFVNQDAEYPVLPAVDRLRQVVAQADAVWIFSPEYNFSYPGYLKNMLDWLSRTSNPKDPQSTTAIAGKKVTVTGIGGKFATKGMIDKLTELLTFIKADLAGVPPVGLSVNAEAWATNKVTLSEVQKEKLQAQANAFLKVI